MYTNQTNQCQVKFLVFMICAFSAFHTSAQTIKAIKKDVWSNPATWDLSRVPLPSDTVIIDGYDVTLDGSATVAKFVLTNNDGLQKSTFKSNSSLAANVLVVTGNLEMTSHDFQHDVEFTVDGSDSVYVGGNLIMTRTADNNSNKRLEIDMKGSSRMTIEGHFYYDYLGSKSNENQDEIDLNADAIFKVKGNTNIEVSGGTYFNFNLTNNARAVLESNLTMTMTGGDSMFVEVFNNATFELAGNCTVVNSNNNMGLSKAGIIVGDAATTMQIKGDLNLVSSGVDKMAKASVIGGNTLLKILGDVNLNANSSGTTGIATHSGSKVRLGGSVQRLSNEKYGFISMDANCSWIYDGTGPQTVACTESVSNGPDAFVFASIQFENESGANLTLEGPLEVAQELQLNKGVLVASDTSPVIINENVIISGGSEDSYISGPVIRKGSVPVTGFVFPLGDNGTYAPLEISEVTSNNAEYRAEYIGCPPPLGSSLDPLNLTNISGVGYWEFERGATSPATNIRLHWTNAAAQGITDPNDLVVARYDSVDGHWTSAGNGAYLAGPGSSGSVMNAIGCPPPLGTSINTIGSASGMNPLPVVMTAFSVRPKAALVEINWEANELANADYYIVEKSSNGINFEPIKKVVSSGLLEVLNTYTVKDHMPFNGNNYYRICQVDVLGMKVYTATKLAQYTGNTQLSIYPNPVADFLNVKGDFNSTLYHVEIIDQSGKLIRKTEVIGEKGYLQIDIQDMALPQAGVYMLHIHSTSRSWSVPFLKV